MISDSLIHQLRGRGFLAEHFETGAQAKEAGKSVGDLAKEAKDRAAEKNLARPEKAQAPKSQDLAW